MPSEIDDYTQPWTFEDNSLDYVHLRWLVGTITDWTELFRQAYRVLKPGGWIETFEANGFYESDDGTLTDKTALSKWGTFFEKGSEALGSKASFTVVRDHLQTKGLNEAGFQRVTENYYKASPVDESHLLIVHHFRRSIADYYWLIQVPVSEWAKDPKYKQIGLITHAALENDTEGVIGFMATQIGWTKEEVTAYAAHLRKELRTNAVHAYYRANIVYAQQPPSS